MRAIDHVGRRLEAGSSAHHSAMQASSLRVVIAEDSVLIREGIARLIEESGGTVIAKVGDGDAFVEAVETYRPDVSVVDVRMPPSQRDEGLRAAIEARRRIPGSPILVLSQYVERQYATELLADGAGGVGYLLRIASATSRSSWMHSGGSLAVGPPSTPRSLPSSWSAAAPTIRCRP